MSEPYLIKKYANRRLYDMTSGEFVTLAELDHLIREGHTLKVVDSKGRDITRSVLLQILAEREEDGEPILSIEVMHDMIRMYGNVMQGPFGSYLEEGMRMLREQRRAWGSMVEGTLREGAPAAVNRLMEQQMELWKKSQEAFFNLWGGGSGSDKPKQDK